MEKILKLAARRVYYCDKDTNEKIYAIPEGIINADNVTGNLTGVTGDLSGVYGHNEYLAGNLTGIKGNITGVMGNVDKAGITEEERKAGIHINDLIVD